MVAVECLLAVVKRLLYAMQWIQNGRYASAFQEKYHQDRLHIQKDLKFGFAQHLMEALRLHFSMATIC